MENNTNKENQSKNLIHGKYEVLKQLGKGATAKVYLVKDVTDNKLKALKMQVKQEQATGISHLDKRFVIEAKTLSKFNHKNIVKIYEYFSYHQDKQIIVMEYIIGKELETIINEKGKINPKKASFYMIQILEAIHEIHKFNIYHRDLKPSNIMLTFSDEIKLMDFGSAQVSKNQNLTRQQSLIGTLQYIAPEQFEKNIKANTKTEIWAMGIIFYKMLTGKLPFTGNTQNDIVKEIINKNPLSPSEILHEKIDSRVEKILFKMLKKDPYERYDSAPKIIEELNEYINSNEKDYSNYENKKTQVLNPNKSFFPGTKQTKYIILILALGFIGGLIALILLGVY